MMTVKALIWSHRNDQPAYEVCADCPFGRYAISPAGEHGYGWKQPRQNVWAGFVPTCEEAKAAAQADYEDRILSALTNTSGDDDIGPYEQALRDAVEPFLDWLEQREEGAHIKEVREGLIGVEDVIPDDHVVLGAHPRAHKDKGVLTIGHFRRLQSAYDGNPSRANTSGDDEVYEIGKRDGYSEAVQQIDQLTGGDGEYRYCTDHDPDRHTPGPTEMIQRIVDRFETLNLLDDATKTGRDQEWGISGTSGDDEAPVASEEESNTVHDFAKNYVWDGSDEGCVYTPTDPEKSMIEDAILSYLATLKPEVKQIQVGWETAAEWELEQRFFHCNESWPFEDVRKLVNDLWKQYCLAAAPQSAAVRDEAAIRNAALEDAAKVAETGDWYGQFQTVGDERRAQDIASRIRALHSTQEG